jgi:FemAB-related protein (PEP-CTERM system-associated)
MGVETLKPGREDEWDEYVHKSAQATFYHQTTWKRALEETYGLQSFYLLARDGGKITGILPLFLVKGPLFASSLVSVPFAPYGGVCADDGQIARGLVDAAKEITVRRGVRYLELRHFNECDLNLPGKEQYVTLILELTEDPDELWKSFRAKVRNQVRKTVKSGLEFCVGREYLPDFYAVYAEHMRDLGTPVHDLALFRRLADECPEQTAVFVVRQRERTIGGMLAARFKDTLNDLWACSLRRYFEYCPNNLLYWNAMRFGCERGLKLFDFGRSTRGSGTFKFKEQWGARVQQLRYYQYASGGRETFDSTRPGLGKTIFVRGWRRLPVSLTKVLGPWIRKGVP